VVKAGKTFELLHVNLERRSIEADGTMKVQTTITMMQGRPAPPPPPGAGGPQVFKRAG